MSGPRDSVSVAHVVAASPAVVWRALTAGRAQWWPDLRFDAVVGAPLVETWVEAGQQRQAHGVVTRCDEAELLAFRWREDGWSAPLEVRFRLEAHDLGTSVTLTETGFRRADVSPTLADEHEEGWRYHLTRLARACGASDDRGVPTHDRTDVMNVQPSALLRAVRAAGLLADPVEEEGVVRGPARLEAAGYDVSVNLDPDPEFDPLDDEVGAEPVEPASLIAAAEAFLTMSAARWGRLIDEILEEIEGAGRVAGREDLTIEWVAVVPDAYLVSFPVPRESPEVFIRAQLDADFRLDELYIDEDPDEDDDDDDAAVDVASLEALLDELNGKDASGGRKA